MREIRKGLFFGVLFCAAWSVRSQEFSLAPVQGDPFRFKDYAGQVFGDAYIQSYSYANAHVTVTLDPVGKAYLAGSIDASGLKPNFAYQIKLAGRNSKLRTDGTGDDATNERLGSIGRWWRAYPSPANSNDADFAAHKDDPNYAYSGYLIVGFFLTDANGSAVTRFEGHNSFHVLWRTSQRPPAANDGPIDDIVLPATAGNPAYDSSNPGQAVGIYGEWEPTRALPGTLAMPQEHYACDFILTEESFHDISTYAGNWTAAMGAPIEFDIGDGGGYNIQWSTPADIVYPTPLSSVQLNATAAAPGNFVYSPPAGTVLSVGTHTLSAQFTPTDPGPAALPKTVSLNVLRGTPQVQWFPPANIHAEKALDEAVLNATANVAGHFVYDPAAGTKLAAGAHTLIAQFVPDDQVNYVLPNAVSVQVEAISGLLTTSGPWVTPNPAYAGFAVQFVAGSDSRGVRWVWNFGDGTAAADQSVCVHTYSAPGTYTATVTVQSRTGQSESEQVGVVVLAAPVELSGVNAGGDADGDGFDNGLELAWGSDPAAANSLDGANGRAPEMLQVSALSARISMAGGPARCHCTDRFQIKARVTLSVLRQFMPEGKRLGISVSGMARSVGLDAKGRAKLDGVTVSLRKKAGRGEFSSATVNITMDGKYGDLPAGLMEPYTTGTLRDGWLTVVLDGHVYRTPVKLAVNNGARTVILKSGK